MDRKWFRLIGLRLVFPAGEQRGSESVTLMSGDQ
jgi:hypothetical protein